MPHHPEFGKLTLIRGGKHSAADSHRHPGMDSTTNAAVRQFESDLKKVRRTIGFLSGRGTATFARDLSGVLRGLKRVVNDPHTGVEIAAAFFRSDDVLFNECDDSSGSLGDVFRYDGRELFVHFAGKCEEKEWLGDVVFELMQQDDYGVREAIIDSASEYLPGAVLRSLIERFQVRDQRERKGEKRIAPSPEIESLLRQIHDAPLYEQITLAEEPEPGAATCINLGEVYLESGDPGRALSWLMRVPPDETAHSDRRDLLLAAAHTKLGNTPQAQETAWRIFRRSRNAESFRLLLDSIGPHQRDRIIEEETKLILETSGFSHDDGEFLVMCGRMDEAETYLLARARELDGNSYVGLNRLAAAMENGGRFLAASVIHRVLLESILARAVAKYYTHGVRYLRKIDTLAPGVKEWRGIVPHETYVAGLRQTHARKTSFWSLYGAHRSRGSTRR